MTDDSLEIFDLLVRQKPAIDWDKHGERAHDAGENAKRSRPSASMRSILKTKGVTAGAR
jgi:hypothetical protein